CHWINRAVAQSHGATSGQRMLRRHDGNDALLNRHQWLEVSQKWRPKHQGEIDVVIRQSGHGLLVVEHLDIEGYQWMLFAEFADLPRQKLERERLTASNSHGAPPHALQVLDLR